MDITTPNNLHIWQNRINKKSDLFLCEGDSWFSYPGESSNILFPYDIPTLISDKIDLVNFALFGSTTKDIIKDENIKFIKDRLSYILHSKTDNKIIKYFLLSIGGNDLINNIGTFIKEGNVDLQKFYDVLQLIQNNIQIFINETKEFLNPDIKYVLHSYDYININTIGEGFESWFTKTRSWVFHSFVKNGIENKEKIFEIMKIVIDEYFGMLKILEKNNKNVFIIDLRNTLKDLKYWENEIHPSKEGFQIIATKYYKELKEK